jgi:hypothetical protein
MSPGLIAWFGHSGSQVPQLMQFSVIIIAMTASSFPGDAFSLSPAEPDHEHGPAAGKG